MISIQKLTTKLFKTNPAHLKILGEELVLTKEMARVESECKTMEKYDFIQKCSAYYLFFNFSSCSCDLIKIFSISQKAPILVRHKLYFK